MFDSQFVLFPHPWLATFSSTETRENLHLSDGLRACAVPGRKTSAYELERPAQTKSKALAPDRTVPFGTDAPATTQLVYAKDPESPESLAVLESTLCARDSGPDKHQNHQACWRRVRSWGKVSAMDKIINC